MMNMREKMARAIHALDHQDSTPAWDDLEDWDRAHYLAQADAALDALMEPTEPMFCAAQGWPDAVMITDVWQAMLRAAKVGK